MHYNFNTKCIHFVNYIHENESLIVVFLANLVYNKLKKKDNMCVLNF